MWTMTQIRRHIYRLPPGQPLTTRDLLNYGSRAAVDQAVCRLVKAGELQRLARGVFFRPDPYKPRVFTAFEIAKLKAESFGRRLISYAGRAARKLGLTEENPREIIFAIDGSSSSFRMGESTIYLRKISPRKMHLGDSKAGLVIRALWHLGESSCTAAMVSTACQSLDRAARKEIRMRAAFMPYWLNSKLNHRRTVFRFAA